MKLYISLLAILFAGSTSILKGSYYSDDYDRQDNSVSGSYGYNDEDNSEPPCNGERENRYYNENRRVQSFNSQYNNLADESVMEDRTKYKIQFSDGNMRYRKVLFGFLSNNFEANESNKLKKFHTNIKDKKIDLDPVGKKRSSEEIFRKLKFLD